jgi:hypothetical protein
MSLSACRLGVGSQFDGCHERDAARRPRQENNRNPGQQLGHAIRPRSKADVYFPTYSATQLGTRHRMSTGRSQTGNGGIMRAAWSTNAGNVVPLACVVPSNFLTSGPRSDILFYKRMAGTEALRKRVQRSAEAAQPHAEAAKPKDSAASSGAEPSAAEKSKATDRRRRCGWCAS